MRPDGRCLLFMFEVAPHGNRRPLVYGSLDGGTEFHFMRGCLSRVNDFGAPGSLVRMSDDRLVMVYGYRTRNYGIRAAVSEDGGQTWGSELIVRDDGVASALLELSQPLS